MPCAPSPHRPDTVLLRNTVCKQIFVYNVLKDKGQNSRWNYYF